MVRRQIINYEGRSLDKRVAYEYDKHKVKYVRHPPPFTFTSFIS